MWISIQDGLPPVDKHDRSEEVLVSCSYGILVATLSIYRIAYYRKVEEHNWTEKTTGCGCCGAGHLDPTHWMTLPQAPKDES